MRFVIVILLGVLLASCYNQNKQELVGGGVQTKEVIIYCENVMVPPLMEIKDKFELQFDCKIKLHNDCSQNLASLVRYSLAGDIYIPGSRESFSKLQSKYYSYISDSVFVGYNNLVVMSLKGNPSDFNGELNTLADKKHAVIIANPETSSLGYETRKLLDSKDMYNDIKVSVVALSTDSRGLIKSLLEKEAQLVINWKSDLLNNDSAEEIELFAITESEELPAEIYAGLLSTSSHKDLAKKFLTYATSEEGLEVFRKYGFTRRKSLIF